MSKALEALNRIETTFSMNKQGKESVYREYTNSIYPYYEDFDLVLKSLKALEIIKEKNVIVEFLKYCKFDLETYNADYYTINLTQEEINLLKEVMGNE